jgi:hypothetical protein
MSATDSAGRAGHDDRQLVDLVASALVNPNLHTDTRMRLHRELTELLWRAHKDLRQSGKGADTELEVPTEGGHLPGVLESVLVDPSLHTDARLRLHREIQELLRRHARQ